MTVFLYFLMLYCMGGISASVTYHRILAHRMAALQPVFRKILIIIALPAGTPVQWVGTHRQHHQFADQPGDPHSPVVDGFWYAHCGWYIQSRNSAICCLYALSGIFRLYIDGYWRPRSNQEFNHKAKDIQRDQFCSWVSRTTVYPWILWVYATLLIGIGWWVFGKYGILINWAGMVIVYNLGDSINSFSHLSWPSNKGVRHVQNYPVLAWFTFGEGWHADHHNFPNRVHYAEADLGYIFMRFFAFLGLLRFTLFPHHLKQSTKSTS